MAFWLHLPGGMGFGLASLQIRVHWWVRGVARIRFLPAVLRQRGPQLRRTPLLHYLAAAAAAAARSAALSDAALAAAVDPALAALLGQLHEQGPCRVCRRCRRPLRRRRPHVRKRMGRQRIQRVSLRQALQGRDRRVACQRVLRAVLRERRLQLRHPALLFLAAVAVAATAVAQSAITVAQPVATATAATALSAGLADNDLRLQQLCTLRERHEWPEF